MQGQERRVPVESSLKGLTAADPVMRNIPGVSAGSAPQVQATDTFTGRVANMLGEYGDTVLLRRQQAEQRRSTVDGQIAQVQGKAFDEVQMEGDKYALEGYRVMEAGALATSMQQAAQREIADTDYEMDPNDYRKKLTERITTMTGEVSDERTRTMVTDTLMSQVPELVSGHMTQHLAYKEQKNFDVLSNTIDINSRQGASADAMVAIASGASPLTAGLSEDRRRKAVTQGIINAYQNDNPNAYALLEQAGALTTENFSVDELNAMASAKNAWHTQKEQEFSLDHTNAERAIKDKLYEPGANADELIMEMAANDALYGRRSSASRLGPQYDAMRENIEFQQGTRGINIQAAGLAGDYDTQAALMTDAVEHVESRGRADAVSPKGATGLMQLMPATAMNPGYNVPDIFQTAQSMGVPVNGRSAAEADRLMRIGPVNKRMGTNYMSALLREFNGDAEVALVAYNAGPARAKEFVAVGKDWNKITGPWKNETQPYVKNVSSAWGNNTPDPNADRVAAEARLKQVQEQSDLTRYQAAQPELDRLDNRLKTDTSYTEQSWRQDRESVRANHGLPLSREFVTAEAGTYRTHLADQAREITDAAKAQQDQMRSALDAQQTMEFTAATAEPRRLFDKAREDFKSGSIGLPELQTAFADLTTSEQAARQALGVPLDSGDASRFASDMTKYNDALSTADALSAQRAQIDRAVLAGAGDTLSGDNLSRATKDIKTKVQQRVMNQNPNMAPDQQQQVMQTEYTQELARKGMVDSQQKAILNSALKNKPMDGAVVNEGFVEALRTLHTIRKENPGQLDRWLDTDNRGVWSLADSMMTYVAGEDPALAATAIGGMQAGGSRETRSAEALQRDPEVQRGIAEQVRNETIGANPNVRFLGDALAFDNSTREDTRQVIRDIAETEAMTIYSNSPWMGVSKASELATQRAADRVMHWDGGNDSGTLVAPEGKTINGMVFGNWEGEYSDDPKNAERAVREYLYSDEFQDALKAANPDYTPRVFGVTERRGYTLTMDMSGTNFIVTFDTSIWNDNTTMPVSVQPRDIGAYYHNKRRSK